MLFSVVPTSMAGGHYTLSMPAPSSEGIGLVYILPINSDAVITTVMIFENGTEQRTSPVVVSVSCNSFWDTSF